MEKKPFVSIANTYLERFPVLSKQLVASVPDDLGLAIVIPAFDEPDLKRSLKSIEYCVIPDGISVEVIIVINHPEGSSESIVKQNLINVALVKRFQQENLKQTISFHVIYASNLPKKNAGVGWARKIGMDEALRRFLENKLDGLICCFDADSLVDENYFTEITNTFNKADLNGASIYFEHPLSGEEFDSEIYEGILMYETHLRYYKNALKYCGIPYAYHTVGSSMVVKASAYAKQGGMNRRKAGEDFYFINKIINLGNYGEVNTTRVVPSPRISDRVPFGTGRAIQEKVNGIRDLNITYSFEIFQALKEWFLMVLNERNYKYSCFPEYIQNFINEEEWLKILKEISNNTASDNAFKQRFFKTYNAFWVLKYVHFAKENYLPDSSLLKNANDLLIEFGVEKKETILEIIEELKKIDRK